MFHMPMSSPMITTMLGRCPAGVGCCCACAGVAKPALDSAEAANNELPLNSKSRPFSAPPLCVMPSSDFPFTWSLLMTHSFSDDAPETDMACRGVDRFGMARGRTIAAAIVRCAQMRSAFKHFAWNLDVWLTRVVARGLGPAARIRRNAARLRGIGIVRLRIPISRPLPDIADHVVQAVAVSWECGWSDIGAGICGAAGGVPPRSERGQANEYANGYCTCSVPRHRNYNAPATRTSLVLLNWRLSPAAAPVTESPIVLPPANRRERCPKSTNLVCERAIGSVPKTVWKWRARSRVKRAGVMGVAFEMTRIALGIAERRDDVNEMVAKRIMEDLLCERIRSPATPARRSGPESSSAPDLRQRGHHHLDGR